MRMSAIALPVVVVVATGAIAVTNFASISKPLTSLKLVIPNTRNKYTTKREWMDFPNLL